MTTRVLIVDDHEGFRQAARLVVEATAGFEVAAEAETGEASVRLALALMPDLVLMDVHLPDIDGVEATRRMRAQAAQRGPVVLLLSTCEAADHAEDIGEVGAAAYIPKSEFSPARLASAWSAAVAG